MKIAIIGSGISGLVCARLLAADHDVHVFETNDYIGGHTNTIQVLEGERSLPVDTGFIVFNEPNYPNLCRLFDMLDVESRDSDMSFSVKCERSGLEYNGSTLASLFAQKSNIFNIPFLRMLRDILAFHKQAPRSLANGLDDITTVAEFAGKYRYSEYFLEKYLVPLGASLWSCPPDRFKQFPIRFVLEFLENHCMLQVDNRPVWKTVVGGSSSYVGKLVAPFTDNIHLRSRVTHVARVEDNILVQFEDERFDYFDEVIMACHADQALRLVSGPNPLEQDVLGQFEYQYNETVLHTDTRILPEKNNAWASWNYRIPEATTEHTQVTYNMNMLQGLDSEHTYCVSLNQTGSIQPDKVIRTIGYHHPVFKPGRNEVQQMHERLIRCDRISYCGAYWGFGFHEDGVRSGLRVCEAFGKELNE